MRTISRLLAIAVFTSALGAATPAAAQSRDFKRLSAEWWQWALSIPPATNPLIDAPGENCMVGQRDDVWFLAGGFFGGTYERTCKVPEGVALFFPVVNSVQIDTPGVCGQEGSVPVKVLRSIATDFVSGTAITNLTLKTANNSSIPLRQVRRVESTVFPVALPESNLFDAPCHDFGLGNVPAGIYSPAVDTGVYVFIDRLEPGTYTLQMAAENPSQDFAQSITYHLVVVPAEAE